jgi:undecaprenyl diphosphate synthase
MSDNTLSGVETTDRACTAMTAADRPNGALSAPADSAAKVATSSPAERQTSSPQVPRHVAVVMDGNGRWARSRFMPRFFGHKQGVDALVRAVNLFADRGVQYLTVFAFSSENWKRPAEEVTGLMSLVLVAVSKYLSKLEEDGVRIRVVGDRTGVSDKLRWACEQAEEKTRHNTRITLAVAFNYGGRWDVLQACQRALAQGLAPEQLDERWLASQMALSFAPDPDLFIRTGGEMRMSNFLLWQSAYSELFFTECLWPDFGAAEIDAALQAYASRERRFGGIAATPLPPTDLRDRS